MGDDRYMQVLRDGLWRNNGVLVQLLGLCPLLAVSGSVVNALGMGLATIAVLAASSALVATVRLVVPNAIRLPVFVLIIASSVTVVELLMQALAYGMYEVLGIFLPLITTNCIVLGRAEAFASRNPVAISAFEGMVMGSGFAATLIVLERCVNCSATARCSPAWTCCSVRQRPAGRSIRSASTSTSCSGAVLPGAFIFTGLLIAAKNGIDAQLQARRARTSVHVAVPGSKRVRVTGNIG